MRKTSKILSIAFAVGTAAAMIPVAAQATTPNSLHWGACPKDPLSAALQCATLQVPLDYQHPQGRKIELTISKLASKNPAKRRGVLFTNPGGPGPGLSYPGLLTAVKLPQEVRDSYDVIGFDPRGFGHSTPVNCNLTAEQQLFGNIPPYAKNAADVQKHAEETRQIASQCAKSSSSWMLPYISTANTARDMDSIRAALGESKISYDGTSWGTYLGAVYTTLFPQRSDRVVLDSNLGPGGWDYNAGRLYARGFEERFSDFAKFAAANYREYGIGRTPTQVKAKYFELARRLDKKPVAASDVNYDGAMFRLVTFTQLYGPTQMTWLAKAFAALDANQPPPPFPGAEAGAPSDASPLISGRYYTICNDSRWPQSVATYQRGVATDRFRYPMFGAAAANIQPCAFWPNAIEPPVRIGDKGPSNVLMVQNLRDPATPLSGAQQLRRAFGHRATMVTADQGGHGVYLFGANECANNAVTSYLVDGKRPTRDYRCSAEAAPR